MAFTALQGSDKEKEGGTSMPQPWPVEMDVMLDTESGDIARAWPAIVARKAMSS